MAHYGTLADYRFTNQREDIRGAHVYGRGDERLGKVKDVVLDHSTGAVSYLVVDSGDCLRLLPADRVFRAAADENDFLVDMPRERFNSLPDFDEKMLQDERHWMEHEQQHSDALKDWRSEQEKLYEERWHDGVVQHQHGSTRNITPDPAQPIRDESDENTVPARRDLTRPMGSMGEDLADIHEQEPADVTPRRLQGKFPEARQSSAKLHATPEAAHDRSLQQAHVGSERVPQESVEQNRRTAGSGPRYPAGQNLRNDYNGERSARWGRFEELLRKNHVDIQAKCPSCAPKKAA
jgi:sporulation protein YlmC with PRC-barrel domain